MLVGPTLLLVLSDVGLHIDNRKYEHISTEVEDRVTNATRMA